MGRNDERVEIIREYFRRVDRGDPSIQDLYTDDVEIYFPKFGFGRGRAAVDEFVARLSRDLGSLSHDIDGLEFVIGEHRIAVEGREWGTTADGSAWPDGTISQGRFCNVFSFEGKRISSVHIYTDPDFASTHAEKVAQLADRSHQS